MEQGAGAMAGLAIRAARIEDGAEAARLLVRSITELCGADHRNDARAVAGWTANKTPEAWAAWVRHPGSVLRVAEADGRIVGVGMMRKDGEILLNYVHPEARFRGVSAALMDHLEAEAVRLGCAACTLESTITARAFYEARGYAATGGCGARGGGLVSCLRMRKALA